MLVDPTVLADAKAKVSAARSALQAGDTKTALASMAKVPAAARADKAFATDADARAARNWVPRATRCWPTSTR